MNEGSVLLWLEEAVREDDYDLIIVDSAPTGETLTLLTLPQVTQWWLAKAFPFQKMAVKSLGFGVRTTTGIPLEKRKTPTSWSCVLPSRKKKRSTCARRATNSWYRWPTSGPTTSSQTF
jgi:anion-transporting  ArsA/GET3 family ATPase